MNWNGEKLKTVGDIAVGIKSCQTKKEAQKFLETYAAETEYAKENIGYLIGYLSTSERERLYDLFNIVHPVYRLRV